VAVAAMTIAPHSSEFRNNVVVLCGGNVSLPTLRSIL